MIRPLSIPVHDLSQAGEVRRAAARMGQDAGLSEVKRGVVAIVATELAKNLARYGHNGRVLLQPVTDGAGAGLDILAVDSGPGMADVQKCLQDGFSTGGTPGTGLGAVRRLSTAFDLYSLPGKGTVAFSRVSDAASSAAPAGFEWAAVSTPAPHEELCGDAWRVAVRDREISVMVVDGLGHGPLAAEAADLAARLFEQQWFDAPAAFCEGAHRALSGSRGAAVAAARVSSNAVVSYAGVGNISGCVVSPQTSRGMMSQNGTAGLQVRRVQQFDYQWPERALLVMHSDGLSNRWSLDAYQGLITRHPAVIAGVLHRDFLRGRDDATIVVVRAA
jgi:anti-sigma regulatory factor (Ser/Thr protein kinase)